MLPWIMWTIDSLLLAQEVNTKYLGNHADTFDVLAGLSTSATMRYMDCEVLEFAGDTYWKLVATAYQYFLCPTSQSSEMGKRVRNITNNVPLTCGMRECGAVAYVMHNPVDIRRFLPLGCGHADGSSREHKPHLLAEKVSTTAVHTRRSRLTHAGSIVHRRHCRGSCGSGRPSWRSQYLDGSMQEVVPKRLRDSRILWGYHRKESPAVGIFGEWPGCRSV